MSNRHYLTKPAFTIVELLIVIVVIAILAAITVVAFNGAQNRAVQATLQADIDKARKKIMLYHAEYGNYPTAINCTNPISTEVCVQPSGSNAYSYSVNNASNPATFTLNVTNGTFAYQASNTSTIEPLTGVIKPGLALYLDAGEATSYPGSGTTWNDISGSGKNATLMNGVAYSSGNPSYFTFDGVDDYVYFSNPLMQTQLGQAWTVQAWINIGSKPAQQFVGGLNQGLYLEFSSGTNALLYLNAGAHDYYTYGGQLSNQGWVFCTYRFDNATGARQIWRNLTNISTNGPNLSSTPSGQSGTFTIGTGSNRTISGKVSNVLFYNRYITDAEIAQNFNALRGRYGV